MLYGNNYIVQTISMYIDVFENTAVETINS